MKNKHVGYLIVGIAILIGFIVFSFNRAMTDIVNTSCGHGDTCPMWGTIRFQTNVSIGIIIFVILIGLYLVIFGKDGELIKPKKIEKEEYEKILKTLDIDQRKVLETIIEAQGTIFQSEIVEKSKLSKVKVSRILDKLEGKGLLERRRRGMSNVIILRH
ncbi:MAG: MarR family transcriptional regulator [Candidatus Aenigmarchaeota archaeon]|nr:MarR family transcriptional regulator [Candidatus Aenigmarchaeota archaeon]